MDNSKLIVNIIDRASIADAVVEEFSLAHDARENGDGAASPRSWGFDVDAINSEYALVLWGSKAVVVKEKPEGPIEDRVRVLSLDAFYRWFDNKHTEVIGADGKIKAITWGRAWVTHCRRRQFAGIEFFPNPDGVAGVAGYLNLWRGFGVTPSAEGSYTVFRDHLLNNVCAGDRDIFNYVFAWFAHIFQRPRERVGTALVLRGRMGTGKTKVGEVIGSLIPSHYFPVDDPRYITGQFNAHMASCLLLQGEEAVWAGDKAAEGRLKGLITSEFQMIEQKGIDPIRLRNYVRLLMTSNEDWVIPAGADERRFCVLDVHPRCAQNHDYFAEMDDELARGGRARLLHDLLTFDISVINLRQAPRTQALLEQKLRSFDQIESWWYNRLLEGSPTRGMEGWPEWVPNAALFSDYVKAAEEIGVRRKRDPAAFGVKLGKLVPGLTRARPRIEIEPGMAKRVWGLVLPPLEACRSAFEGLLGQSVDWPAIPARDGERREETGVDCEIPV